MNASKKRQSPIPELVAAGGGKGKVTRHSNFDLTKESARELVICGAAEGMGGLNLAVSCAGVATPGKLPGRGGQLSSAVFQRALALNTTGIIYGERGLRIPTVSVVAFESQIGQVACATSKAAVAGTVLQRARKLARFGIRVVETAPGCSGRR